MNTTSNEAALICAQLLRQGFVRKVDFPQLELNDILLTSVRDRLLDVGMELVMNSYSDFYAVKMTRESQDTIEESNNLSLRTNEVAMLVILWSKLILPKRTAARKSLAVPKEKTEEVSEKENTEESTEESTEKNTEEDSVEVMQQDFFQEEKKENKRSKKKKKKEDQIYVQLSELYAEFGKQFGSKTPFKATITRLSNLKFIHMHNEIISEGIFLDLLIDGYQMGNEIKKSALAYKLAGVMDDDEWDDNEFLEADEEINTSAIELQNSENEIQKIDSEEVVTSAVRTENNEPGVTEENSEG